MVGYREICLVGELLRKKHYTTLTLNELTKILMAATNCHHSTTIRNYIRVLVDSGYIKSIKSDYGFMWEVIYDEKRGGVIGQEKLGG
jgi:hypothetical protein